MTHKICTICNKNLEVKNFYIRETKPSGEIIYKSWCKSCSKKKTKEYAAQNKDKIKEQKKEYARLNKDRLNKARTEARNKAIQDPNSHFNRKIARYIEEHGVPTCSCGCGEPVKFEYSTGLPRRTLKGHKDTEKIRKAHKTFQERHADNYVPIEKFRSVMLRLKEEKNLTVKDISRITGFPESRVNQILYAKKYGKTVGIQKSTVEFMLRRLAGLPTVATVRERNFRSQPIRLPGGEFCSRVEV